MNFEQSFNEVKILVEDFRANESYYLATTYSEASVRQDFIDKLFTILGWDVAHNFQKNPFEQEVKVEKPQKQEGHQSQKRADYAFALAPNFKQTQFFVEAKKPSRLLRQNRDDYFQTAKYGWNSQTGISILTDFQEIVIIDCRFKPDFETILQNEITYYNYKEFLDEEKFAEFYFLFSREAVSEGKLRTYVESLPKPKIKGKQLKLFAGKYKAIDEDFLEYIDEIRKNLAIAFYQNNPNLEDYELTEATQRTIDRLVFMRFLEDKSIEPEDIIHLIATAQFPWQKFVETCKRFDAKYNGIIFKKHFIDDDFAGANEELFRSICTDLDHTNTPYDFNYFPIHILGNIYERFLGKVITIENGVANIELKPEVRKAGGVFYTPKYIVDYIVENTIGKLIADKTPKQIAVLTFADIACGSGSFLIGVYEYLLDYHLKYYNEKPDEAKKAGCIYDPENQIYVLSIKQKQEILTNNVFGVDIDQQATEVTQVSLFLKLLEDETMATANDMNVLFAEKILPDLSGNIKCGNSLIGWEIMDGVLDFGQKELRKLNPFSFEEAFPKVFSKGGFDAVVGNPPYVFTREGGFSNDIKEYYKIHYFEEKLKGEKTKGSQSGKANLYALFILKGKKIINNNGILSYIIPNTFLRTTVYETTRKSILEKNNIFEIVDLKNGVFVGATVSTIIISIGNLNNQEIRIIDNPQGIEKIIDDFKVINKSIFCDSPNLVFNILSNTDENIFKIKLLENNARLSDYISVFNGIATFKNKQGISKIKENDNFKKLLTGKDIKRYSYKWNGLYIDYRRENLLRAREEEIFVTPEKLVMQRIGGILITAYDSNKFYTYNSVNNILLNENSQINLKFILGILNSNLLVTYYKKFISNNSTLTVNISKTLLDNLPIPKIISENQNLHDELVKLVDQMLKAKEEEQHAKTDMDKTLAKRRCDNLDFRINQIVYQLYDLSAEEIDLVEQQ